MWGRATGGGVSASAVAGATVPVFAPGSTESGPNLYTDWAALIAGVAAMPSPPLYIDIDNSFVSPVVIPATGMPVGGWDLRGAVLRAAQLRNPVVAVQMADGAMFAANTWAGIESITFTSVSTSPIYTASGTQTLFVRNGATISNAGGGASMMTVAGVFAIVMQTSTLAATATFPIVDGTAASAIVAVFTYANSVVGVDALRSSAPGLVAGLVQDAASRVDAQPTPGLTQFLAGNSTRVGFTASVPANWGGVGAPTNDSDAINRIAAVVAANFGAIP